MNFPRHSFDYSKNQEDYRTLTERLPQLIWTATPEGSVTYANDRCLEYTGLSTEEKYGEGWVATIHPEDLFKVGAAWAHSMETGISFKEEYRIKRYDGQYRWFLGKAVAVRNGEGNILNWIGTATEIEEQKIAIAKLEEERRLREQFVDTLTHDLRNSLSAAKLSAQQLGRMAFEKLTREKLLEHSERIIDGLNRANQMIENLLDTSKIRAGELFLEFVQVDLLPFLQEQLDEMNEVHGNRFVLSTRESQVLGFWSQESLRRILDNLFSNALKYGCEKNFITVEVERRGEHIALSVHNKGNPIPPEELGMLFDPFTRAANSKTLNRKGWGLGLSIVKSLTEAHRGSLAVESTLEGGTSFTISLPLDAR